MGNIQKLFEYLKAIVGVVADIVVAGWDLMASGLVLMLSIC